MFPSSPAGSSNNENKHSSTNLSSLSNEQLISQLYSIINDQQQRIIKFHNLLQSHMQKIKTLQRKYETEKSYSQQMFNKLQEIKQQNRRLKVDIDLLRSDNLIMRSRLNYQQQQGRKSQNSSNHSKSGHSSSKNSRISGQSRNKDQKYKQMEDKLINIRKIMKKIMKFMQKMITNNDQEETQILGQITQIMKYIR